MNHTEKKVLGVIGGLGPAATAYFMDLVIRMTDAATDQEHLEMIVYNCPSIPDRTGHILDRTKPSPLPAMIRIGKQLAQQGVDHIAIPCMTAHYFYSELKDGIPVPVVNGLAETARFLKERGITKAGVMATDGTIASGLFHQALQAEGIQPIVPSPDRQVDVMHLIYNNIKANLPAEMDRFHTVSHELKENGAQAIILGCTELSLIKRDHPIGAGFIDAMEVLAQQSILHCNGKLKEEYKYLITK